MAKNVTLGDSPENVTVPGYGKTPDEGGKRLDSRLRGNDRVRGLDMQKPPYLGEIWKKT